jgi:hypothetical protein
MSFGMRILFGGAVLSVAVLSLACRAQSPAPDTTEWENEGLKLRLFYPSDLMNTDTEQVMRDGRLVLAGVSGVTDQKVVEATRCLRPALVLRLPQSGGPVVTAKTEPVSGEAKINVAPAVTATVVLAELNIDCLNAEHESGSMTLLNDMAEVVAKGPGMRSIAQPSTYTIGWQKIHMAAGQGQPQSEASGPPTQVYTMGLSTNWNSHLLVWYFTSNSIEMLDRITKTTVRFGRDKAAPLYPLAINNASR